MAVPLPNTTALSADDDTSVSVASNPPSSETSRASTPAPVAPPPTRGNLRQRFKSMTEDMGKSMEDLVVRLRPAKGEGNYKVLAPGTPYDDLVLHDSKKRQKKETWKSWVSGRRILFPVDTAPSNTSAFALGAAAVWTASQPEMMGGELTDLWPLLQNDMRGFIDNMTFIDSAKKAIFENRDFSVGDDLLEQYGLQSTHPILMMPGIVTSGLESWSTDPVTRGWFRARLWGTSTMIRAVLTDKHRWTDAMAIDLETGLDPPGHRVRAAQGLDAASEFIQGYWVWQKIVQNLATIGYDTSNMDLMAYDWRLSYYNLEIRDRYLSRLKARIELLRQTTGKKVVLASHSMGGSLMLYFLKWVEAEPDSLGFGGGGGKRWVEDNVEAWINIAGTLLGVPKAMTAFMSGEMRDTVELNPMGTYVLEKLFSRKERARLFRNWPGASSMWMKGGNRIWGDNTSAPDDPANATDTYGRFFSFRHMDTAPHDSELDHTSVSPNLTLDDAVPYVLTHTPPAYQRMFESNYSVGFETNPKKLKANNADQRKWSNPLEVELPNAPSMKIYCLYGHGKETERSYWYAKGEYEPDEGRGDGEDETAFCEADQEDCERTPMDFPLTRNHWIDNEVTVKGAIPAVRSGVKFSDGDGTIATVSLGAMCVHGWKGKTKYNPAGIEVVTQEYKHRPDSFDLRGGPCTADHVDILGSTPLNEAVLKISAGRGDLVKPHIGSNILEYVKKMRWD